jgi:hypothetical protein
MRLMLRDQLLRSVRTSIGIAQAAFVLDSSSRDLKRILAFLWSAHDELDNAARHNFESDFVFVDDAVR